MPTGTTFGDMLYWNGSAWTLLPPRAPLGHVLAWCQGGPVWTASGICSSPGPPVTDIDGNTYATVIIGTQTRFVENLRTTRCADGTPIPNVTDQTTWSSFTTGAWCWYNYDSANDSPFGKLYNHYAIDQCNVCPAGWHVPDAEDWSTLFTHLGGDAVAGSKSVHRAAFCWGPAFGLIHTWVPTKADSRRFRVDGVPLEVSRPSTVKLLGWLQDRPSRSWTIQLSRFYRTTIDQVVLSGGRTTSEREPPCVAYWIEPFGTRHCGRSGAGRLRTRTAHTVGDL